MSLVRALAASVAVSAVVGLLACSTAPPVRTETYGAGKAARELDIRKVAIAPFRAADSYPRASARSPSAGEAVALVERFVTEALLARGIEVVPVGDVRIALNLTDPNQAVPPARIISMVAAREFGVPAVLTGTVYRMRELAPDAMGASRAASVWYEVVLVKAPGAGRLWNASFNETQKPLNENIFNASKYPGGGMRWLRAEELARWGADELAREFPAGIAPPSTRYR
jgi:hypothetical protein